MEGGSPKGRDRTSFNPFQVWLGFPAGRVPTNYYALFGVPLYESDRELIAQLADNMLAHVRQIRPGEHVAEWTELLDIIRAAKEWLCDPEKKKIYDAELEAGRIVSLRFQGPLRAADVGDAGISDLGPGKTRAGGEGEMDTPPRPVAGGLLELGRGSACEIPGNLRTISLIDITYRVAALGLLVIGVLAAYTTVVSRAGWVAKSLMGDPPVLREAPSSESLTVGVPRKGAEIATKDQKPDLGKPQPVSPHSAGNSVHAGSPANPAGSEAQVPEPSGGNRAETPSSESGDPAEGMAVPSPSPPGEPGNRPAMTLPQTEPQAEAEGGVSRSVEARLPSTHAAGDSQITAESRQMLKEIWDALGRRDLEGARATLNRLAAQVRDDSERSIVQAMDQLVRDVEQFWQLMSQIVASLQGTEEFAVADTYVIVVEAGRDYLVIRAAGQNRRYSLREIPTVLLKVLARQRLEPGPDADVLLAAFLAVDPKGDESEVRQLLEQAEAKGADTALIKEALKYRPRTDK